MEQITNETTEQKKQIPAVDRISLGKLESEKLDEWLKQSQEVFKGIVRLSKGDFVNFLIREHKPELTFKELKMLKAIHFDEVKFATWALNKLKEAQKNGDDLTYADLLRLQNSMGKVHDAASTNAVKPRKSKKRKDELPHIKCP